MNKKGLKMAELYTPEGEMLAADTNIIPWQSYPRPHLKRRSFICLNGEWELSLSNGGGVQSSKIRVPFVPGSLLSGVKNGYTEGDRLCYKREFAFVRELSGSKVLLHIDAADRNAEIWLNGKHAGSHSGGYDPIVLDVTELIREKNTIEVTVTDDHKCCTYPYGKQRENRGGMWYTPVAGIWQSVWLEEVPETYVTEIRVESDLSGAWVTVETSCGNASGEITLAEGDSERKLPLLNGRARLEPKEPELWTPESPRLYSFSVCVGEDRVDSYFALRTVTVENGRLCLNGKPYFFHGLLDQGYFSDGIFLPATPEGYDRDILMAKEMGFNMLRKHIKVEPELFYYACDRLGMIVFQDMVNCGKYSFFRDTALPTVGFKRKNDKKAHRDPDMRREFLLCMAKTVKRLSFHPSVCYWTIFNEGWGQFDHASAYVKLKELDRTRPIDSVSGWFSSRRGNVSDVESLHVYFKKVSIESSSKPTVLSEFGGYSHKVEGHIFNPHRNYGYGSCPTPEALQDALDSLYNDQVLPAIKKGLCGAVYTQLTDVEDETNGLLTYDRRVMKVSPEKMRAIAEGLRSALEE